MALEQEIQKLIIAVEALTKAMGQPAPAPAPASRAAKPVKEAPPVEQEVNPFEPEASTAAPAVTFESLTELLKGHAKKLGTKLTIALIIKHGADRTTPKMNTIPEANFKACWDEATADLKKMEGKK